jgi:hypothetical protein
LIKSSYEKNNTKYDYYEIMEGQIIEFRAWFWLKYILTSPYDINKVNCLIILLVRIYNIHIGCDKTCQYIPLILPPLNQTVLSCPAEK